MIKKPTLVVTTCKQCGREFIGGETKAGKPIDLCPACRKATKAKAKTSNNFFIRCLKKILSTPCNTPVKNALSEKEWERLAEEIKE